MFRPKKKHTKKQKRCKSSKELIDLNTVKTDSPGTPIMAANMDGVGELGMAEKLNEYGMITCLTKQHDVKKIKQNKKLNRCIQTSQ